MKAVDMHSIRVELVSKMREFMNIFLLLIRKVSQIKKGNRSIRSW